MYFFRSSYVIYVCHPLRLVRKVMSQYEIYSVAPLHLYEIQHNATPHTGTAAIHLSQVTHGDEIAAPLLLLHVHIYKHVSIKSLCLFRSNANSYETQHFPDEDINTKMHRH